MDIGALIAKIIIGIILLLVFVFIIAGEAIVDFVIANGLVGYFFLFVLIFIIIMFLLEIR